MNKYMHIVGTLLWLSRNCYPEISQGLSQLCSVMSQPTQVAFDAALHMIKYVYSQKDRGIIPNESLREKTRKLGMGRGSEEGGASLP